MVTPNPEIVMSTWDNAAMADAVRDADIVIPDGIGVVKAAKILGTPLKERLPGIEIAHEIMAKLAEKEKSVFLFGAKPGVAEMAAGNIKMKYPGLKVCGMHDGYFTDDAPVAEMINSAKPDFLLVCLGAPKQELWMHKYAGKLDVGLMAGLGGTLDVLAGISERAPAGWQKLGLEWLYRCIKQPQRFKRISKLPLFILKAIKTRIGKMLNGK